MSERLFSPIRVGRMNLAHRVVLAPLTRSRASPDRVVGDLVVEHYALRATVPGTLLLTEANFTTSRDAALPLWPQSPGIWNAEQVAGWKKVVEAVHTRGSYIFCQLWSVGRLNVPEKLAALDPAFPYISAGNVRVPGWSRSPTPLTQTDIKNFVGYFADAATAAVHEAGFDGVEIGATYLFEEFMKSIENDRTDEYGHQCPENAGRFCLEVVDAVVERVGEDRVGIKLNPWMRLIQTDNGVKPSDPRPVYTYVTTELRRRHPGLAYLHVLEPRVRGDVDVDPAPDASNDFLREIWKGKPYITVGGYNRETAVAQAKRNELELVAFGRLYTSNPDLPVRLKRELALTPYERETFYTDGAEEGYNTFRFSEGSKIALTGEGVDVSCA
ncbi:hypothetical protein K488DRAFT_51109 [Vararia minispora EC-137]|uniref:Uncharacterized protein n=1 Tax=Vararia minispora EC-137 TaxID=1314806 RepID=A0ACB8QJ90_9AGAM|nr:hypothetical protein K488DRAFT_51109 [Vararia minispora EC-137]